MTLKVPGKVVIKIGTMGLERGVWVYAYVESTDLQIQKAFGDYHLFTGDVLEINGFTFDVYLSESNVNAETVVITQQKPSFENNKKGVV